MAHCSLILLTLALVALGNLQNQAQAQLVGEMVGFHPDLAMMEVILQKTGLAETLNDAGFFNTAFMPSDAALQAYMASMGITTEQLITSPSLFNILYNHVMPGVIASAVLQTGDVLATMLPGASLGVVKNETGLLLVPSGGPAALVVMADIEATNGLLYVVDRILLPAAEFDVIKLITTDAPPVAEPPTPEL